MEADSPFWFLQYLLSIKGHVYQRGNLFKTSSAVSLQGFGNLGNSNVNPLLVKQRFNQQTGSSFTNSNVRQ